MDRSALAKMIDHTLLKPEATVTEVIALCAEAAELGTYTVCVSPTFVTTALEHVTNGVKVATVCGFPSGKHESQIKAAGAKLSVTQGAHEVDMVIDVGRAVMSDWDYLETEVAAVRAATSGALLKVILETGELGELDKVRRASDIAMYAGADFIKTSTGKISPAATLPVTLVMLEAIRDYYYETGIMIGMKPAGGISNSKLALQYLLMVKETLGGKWLTNEYFRFGASSLANDVLMQIVKQKSGIYQSGDYFSKV